MSKSGGSSTTTVEKADPWSGVQPYLTSLYGQAAALPQQQFYPRQTYAPQSSWTSRGANQMWNYANTALPQLIGQGQQGITSMLGAADVANNPYVNNMIGQQAATLGNQFGQTADRLRSGYGDLAADVTNRLQREWLPGIRSGAGLAGQYGSTRQGVAEGVAMGNATDSLTRYGQQAGQELSALGTNQAQALANAAAQTQLGAYGQGLEQQRAGMAMLPQQAQLGLMPSQLQQQFGAQQEAYQQRQIDDAIARWNFAQQAPADRLALQNSIYSGIPWSKTGTTEGAGGSRVAGALGGALGGYGIGSALGSGIAAMVPGAAATGMMPTMLGMGFGPWGALGGAVLGGLLGKM